MSHQSRTRRPLVAYSGIAVAMAVLAACSAQAAADPGARATTPPVVTATLHDLNGKAVGTARIVGQGHLSHVTVSVQGQAPGYHGLHVHAIGVCDPAVGFVSAGGHVARDNASHHGEHAGDLPSMRVGEDGTGSMSFTTDAFTPAGLLDEDGSALMLHDGRDNFANIPPRYAPTGPDVDTRKTGDAGVRIACGALHT